MPHAVIEYSENLAASFKSNDVTSVIHQTMIASNLFDPENIKTRAYAANDFLVGSIGDRGRFIHLAISILTGRTGEQRQNLSQSLLDILHKNFPDLDSLTVEVREMDRETYRKI